MSYVKTAPGGWVGGTVKYDFSQPPSKSLYVVAACGPSMDSMWRSVVASTHGWQGRNSGKWLVMVSSRLSRPSSASRPTANPVTVLEIEYIRCGACTPRPGTAALTTGSPSTVTSTLCSATPRPVAAWDKGSSSTMGEDTDPLTSTPFRSLPQVGWMVSSDSVGASVICTEVSWPTAM